MADNKLIFDFGTNSIKAFLFDGHKQIYKTKIENRIGDGGENSDITPDIIKNTINATKEILEDANKFGLFSTRAFGTEIFRKAPNASELVNAIENATGVRIQILSKQDELEYYWKGLVKDFDFDGEIAAIDIGGGSIQFMYGDKKSLKGSHHLKSGALYMRKMFIANDPATAEEYQKIEEYIADQIKDIDIKFKPGTPFIHGTSSVIDFYTEAKLDLEPYELSKNHPYKIALAKDKEFYKKLRLLPKADRAKFFPTQPGFTDGASIGLAHIVLIAEKTGLEYVVPSNNSLVHGFL